MSKETPEKRQERRTNAIQRSSVLGLLITGVPRAELFVETGIVANQIRKDTYRDPEFAVAQFVSGFGAGDKPLLAAASKATTTDESKLWQEKNRQLMVLLYTIGYQVGVGRSKSAIEKDIRSIQDDIVTAVKMQFGQEYNSALTNHAQWGYMKQVVEAGAALGTISSAFQITTGDKIERRRTSLDIPQAFLDAFNDEN